MNVSSPLELGMSRSTTCSSTKYRSRPIAPRIAAMPARGRWRRSQASCFSGSCVVTATSSKSVFGPLRPALGVRRRELDPPCRLGPDLVAPDHARRAVAREEDDIQSGRDHADQRLDPAAARELIGTAIGHGGAIVDSPASHEHAFPPAIKAEPDMDIEQAVRPGLRRLAAVSLTRA